MAWVGIWTNLAMGVMKLFIGITSGSKSCIADGLHSFSNIVTAMAIMLSQKVSKKNEDGDYPFGYGKIEFIAAGCISLFIVGAACSLITLTIKHLLSEPSAPPHFSALIAAVISIGTNEILFRYMRCVGTRFKSQAILANAWANRADCFSSSAVVIGVLGSRLGYHHLDPICALFVVIVIIKVSLNILIESINALMDSSLNNVYGDEIIEIVEKIEDVHGIAELRTRHIGQKIWAELNIIIDSTCNMKEGQAIADKVKQHLVNQISDLERVLVYFEPAEA